jgi:hypothetical protein
MKLPVLVVLFVSVMIMVISVLAKGDDEQVEVS